MSLVSGLLNRTCTVMRPQFSSDGGGGETLTGYATIATNFPILITQRSVQTSQQDGGRLNVTQVIIISEWIDETQLNINDVITNVTDPNTGKVELDIVNGVPTPSSFKLTGRDDPNYEHDHLECPFEKYHGRVEGTP